MVANKYISLEQARIKIYRFCAYQERCHQEVKTKLFSLGVYGDAIDTLMVELIDQNFLNEERFAKAFTSGKFRIKKWGKRKIELALKQKGVSAYCIRKGFTEIDPEEYLETIVKIIELKKEKLPSLSTFEQNSKIASYLIGRGFESELVFELINTKE